MGKEIWKPIKGYEGYYEISNTGKVKHIKFNRILKLQKDRDGYFRICLCKNNKKSTLGIHRIVAQVFIPNPENKPCINHINGIKDDNRIENLEWCTVSENVKHAYKMGFMENAGRKNIPVAIYTLDRVFIKKFKSCREAEREIGIYSRNSIVGVYKKMKNYIFKFI